MILKTSFLSLSRQFEEYACSFKGVVNDIHRHFEANEKVKGQQCDSVKEHQLSAIFDDVNEDFQTERKRSSLAWDTAFFTSPGLLNPEELHMLNGGFKKTPPTQKDGKRSEVATKYCCSQSNAVSCKKMNTCSQNKSRAGSIQNAAAVKGLQDKTRTLQDSKRCRSGGLPKSNACSSASSKNSSERKVKVKDMKLVNSHTSVLHVPLHDSYESSPSASSKNSFERKVKPKGMKSVKSRTSVPHFHRLSEISDDVKEDVKPEPKRPSLLRESLAWDSAFFTGDGLLDSEKLFILSKGFKKTPLAQKNDIISISNDVKEDIQPEQKRPSFFRESLAWDTAFFTDDGLLDSEELFILSKGFKKTPLAQKNDKISISDDVKEDIQREPKRRSFLRESLAWDSAFFTSDGLLGPEELSALNKGFKKTPLAQKDDNISKVATKIGSSQSNALSQDSKKTRLGGLPKSKAFTTPTTKNMHCSYESSQNISESKKDNLKVVKLSNSPSSVLYSPLSSSPASSDDGWLSESLCSATVTHQSPTSVLDFHSQNCKENKFICQNATIETSRLRRPSPRIGFFDREPRSMQDHYRLV